jgi:hypothetical protein
MTRTALLPTLLLTLSPLFFACGGDGEKDSSSSQAEPLSKAEFVAQADEICAQGNQEIVTAIEDFPAEPSEQEVTEFAEEVLVPNTQQQHDDIADLGAPEGDEDAVQAILDALQEGIDSVEEDPASLTSSDDPLEEASDLAEAYGLTECGA